MTPQEEAVIEAAMSRFSIFIADETEYQDVELAAAVQALIYSCPRCNAGGHTCPGDGNPIGHTATDCGRHGGAGVEQAAELLDEHPDFPEPTGEAYSAPGPLNRPDENQNAVEQAAELLDSPVTPEDFTSAVRWVETTMTNCLINDRIRLGSEETTVIRSNHGMWHANTANAWQPQRWDHIELRMELEAVPGFKQYPPSASIEILCTPERLAVLRIQEGFPGSAPVSSQVD